MFKTATAIHLALRNNYAFLRFAFIQAFYNFYSMLSSLVAILIACSTFLVYFTQVYSSQDFFHQTSEQYKLSAGWQEPGLWRPKWIMYRTFDELPSDSNGEKDQRKELKDKVVFKLRNDRTVKVFNSRNRPFLEIMKPKVASERKKKLFETGDEEVLSIEEKWRKHNAESKVPEKIDGTWWWQDAAPLNQGVVKIETREGDGADRIKHDVRCDWGTLDGYAAKFRTGKIFKYKMTDAGLPIGTYPVGTFTIRVSPHRPLISKEYIAFE